MFTASTAKISFKSGGIGYSDTLKKPKNRQ